MSGPRTPRHAEGSRWRKQRERFAVHLRTVGPLPCRRCGELIYASDEWDLGHEVDHALGGSDTDVWIEHRHRTATCQGNRSSGRRLGQDLAAAQRLGRWPGSTRLVILLLGAPGSGKSTRARELADALGLEIYDRDDPRFENDDSRFRDEVRVACAQHSARVVVIRSGTTPRARAAAVRITAPTHIDVMSTSAAECRDRVRARNRGDLRFQLEGIDRWFATPVTLDELTRISLRTGCQVGTSGLTSSKLGHTPGDAGHDPSARITSDPGSQINSGRRPTGDPGHTTAGEQRHTSDFTHINASDPAPNDGIRRAVHSEQRIPQNSDAPTTDSAAVKFDRSSGTGSQTRRDCDWVSPREPRIPSSEHVETTNSVAKSGFDERIRRETGSEQRIPESNPGRRDFDHTLDVSSLTRSSILDPESLLSDPWRALSNPGLDDLRRAFDVRSVTDAPLFAPEMIESAKWLAHLRKLPEDAAWPRYMSPAHPEAVGTYGREAVELVQKFLRRPARWWQKLVLYRMLEHDASGDLVWRNVVLSAPRRAGKSVILAALALWRMIYGPDRFADTPTDYVIAHVANTLAAAMEVQRKTWIYARSLDWKVSTANGKEHIEGNGYRWLCQAAKSSGYATGVALGIVDEAWNVAPSAIDEGLEPATMERVSPQLVVVSTAHRKATPTMRRRLASGLAGLGEDWDTLLALWGASPQDAPGDERVWRAASPHWSEDRRRLIAGKFERVMRGEADPEYEDPDPLEGFRAQYLNVWPSEDALRVVSDADPLISAQGWSVLAGYRPQAPSVVALESWYGQGVCVATASALPHDRVGVSVFEAKDLATAATYATGLGVPILAGKSLTLDPALAGAESMSAVARHVVEDLRRLIDDDLLRHDDSQILTDQVLALRVAGTPNGPRVTSGERLDAIKAALWAAQRARSVSESPAVF